MKNAFNEYFLVSVSLISIGLWSVAFDWKKRFYIKIAIQFQGTINAVNTQREKQRFFLISDGLSFTEKFQWALLSALLIFDYDVLKNVLL